MNIIPVTRSKSLVHGIESIELSDLYNTEFDYIVHCASPTSSELFLKKPVDVIEQTFAMNKLCFESMQKFEARGVMLSSVEVYGDVNKSYTVNENDFGEIDYQKLRSSYPIAKRLLEFLIKANVYQNNINVSGVRLTQTFGEGVKPGDARVFAYCAESVLNNKNIILATTGALKRSYLDVLDAAIAIILVLLKGQAGEIYNVSNPNNFMSILELATKIIGNRDLKVEVQLDKRMAAKFSYPVGINMSIDKIGMLGWRPKVEFQETIDALFYSLKNYKK